MQSKKAKIESLFEAGHTIAWDFLTQFTYPWECLDSIAEWMIEMGERLPKDRFYPMGDGIWVAKSANLAPNITLIGPAIIDEQAVLRPGAYLRGGVVVGKEAVVGNSTEVKNAILFDKVQLPHFNYAGDSVLGFAAHVGAGGILSNLKGDKTPVVMHFEAEQIATNRKKVGAFLGDMAEVGCNCVLNPGSILGKQSRIYPLSNFRGSLAANMLYKDAKHITEIRAPKDWVNHK